MRSECGVFEKLPNCPSHLESFSVFHIFKSSSHFQRNSDLLAMAELPDTFSVGRQLAQGALPLTWGVGVSEVSVALCDIITSTCALALQQQSGWMHSRLNCGPSASAGK